MALTMSPREAADEIGGVGESTLREKARRGEIPHVRGPRNSIRFTPEQLAEIVALMTQPVASTKQRAGLTTTRSRSRKAA